MSTALDLSADPAPNGARLVAIDGRALPLLGASLAVDARGGVARVVLEQRFQNPYDEPLTAHYSLPLPEEGAVTGFSFTLGDRTVVGEVDRREDARERFERAVAEGHSAALLEQDRASLFTQEIGNVPPRSELVARITVDQRLRWLDEGAWEWRFPTAVAPRYLGEAGRVADAERVAQDIADGPLPTRMTLALSLRDTLIEGRAPESPSHPLHTSPEGALLRVRFADGGVRLDRDVVVRWAVAGAAPGVSLDVGRGAEASHALDSFGLLSVVPPLRAKAGRPVGRDLVLLLDTSGSMSGAPLSQLRRVSAALVDTLTERDTLEMIEFSSRARRWKKRPVAASAEAKHDAHAWLRDLSAGGGTEMRDGIIEALKGVREGAQRQVVLMTDGQIGFERQVVAEVCDRLPKGSRVHTVGVGSAVNRSLTAPVARAGRGAEVIIGYDEDPERAVAALTRRTDAPLLVELTLSGDALLDHAPRALPDLFGAAPARVSVRLRAEGGELVVRGQTAEGEWTQRLEVPARAEGEGAQLAAALYARERVEDLETALAAGGSRTNIDGEIEALGLQFQVATRLTSWVAISQERAVDPRAPSRRVRVPHELAQGVSAEGVGLRRAGPAIRAAMSMAAPFPAVQAMMPMLGRAGGAPPPPAARAPSPKMEKAKRRAAREEEPEAASISGSFDERDDELPPAPRESAAKSVLGSLKEFFFGAAKPEHPGSGPRGRFVTRIGRALVFEVVAPSGGMTWDPDAEVEITWSDGRVETLRCDETRATRAGHLDAGQIARLSVELPDDAPRATATSLTLRTRSGTVLIIAL